MKKNYFLLLIILLSGFSIFSQKKSLDIVGVYQNCLIGCETYRFNADFTFDFLSSGDLDFGRTKGTWEFIEADKILVKFPKDEIETTHNNKADSTTIPNSDEIIISVDPDTTIQRPFPTDINFTIVIKNKTLCNLDNEGQITYCYKKLKGKKAEKIFPVEK